MSYDHDLLAVVDLGSNSFRLEIARHAANRLTTLLYRKETVRLGGGFDAEGRLMPAAQARALKALERFRECLSGVSPTRILVVGTHAMRQAADNAGFLEAAERTLGHSIEIISGEREAALAFSGAVRSLPFAEHSRIVIDIGGGSTEIALGYGTMIEACASFTVGCVNTSVAFFPHGKVNAAQQKEALARAETVLDDARKHFPEGSFAEAFVTAGTFRAVSEACRNLGWTKEGDAVRPEHVDALIDRLLHSEGRFADALPGLRTERFEVIAGGLTVLQAAYRVLRLPAARLALGGVRVGLLYELLGSPAYRDERDASVETLIAQLALDRAQGKRVAHTADRLLTLFYPRADASWRRRLGFAARLHEIGFALAGFDVGRPGAQLLRAWSLPGFSREEKNDVANLIAWQRGSLPNELVQSELPERRYAGLALRLADLFHHARTDHPIPDMRYDETRDIWFLPHDWWNAHPMTAAFLEEEEHRWRAAGLSLHIRRY